jgi:cysteine desulfurase
MSKELIYLDYNATTAAKLEVLEVIYAHNTPLNPSSVHSFGRKAKAIINDARDSVRKLANAGNAEVIFTSSGTEANNLALRGFKASAYFVSAIEHPSVLNIAKELNAQFLPVEPSGIIDLKALDKLLEKSPKNTLVSVMLANNETGVVQPIKEVTKIVCSHGGLLHCDAAQGFGKIDVDMQDLNVDMLTISAHKFGGPVGAAALLVKKGINIEPIIIGGGQESGKRAGTENIPAIAGFAKACELADTEKFSEIEKLKNMLEQSIKEYAPESLVVAEASQRLPNTSSIYMPGMKAETQVINFDLEGIAISAGSACSSGKVENSHVLEAMGVEKDIARNVIRVSLTPETTREEIEKLIECWKSFYDRASCQEKKLNKAA